jgi:hypothetical protein
MTAATPGAADRGRRSYANVAAFVLGLPAAAGVLAAVHYGPLRDTVVFRYLQHPVEWVEVVLFCCALGALAAKWWQARAEHSARRAAPLPAWDGRPVPVADAPKLTVFLQRLPRRLHNTFLVQRLSAVLDFLFQRKSADDLDDQLRSLADADGVSLEGSYALVRFITWAVPILGFLGTVLGITGAIAGVKSDDLELSQVTGGLAYAFDATALALGLTMVTMFCSFLVEREEQGILEAVDRCAERTLAHRFQRVGADAGPFVQAVQQHAQAQLTAMGQLVERQTDLWAAALAEAEKRSAAAAAGPQNRFASAVEAALEKTLQTHSQRLAALERQSLDQTGKMLGQMTALAAAVRDTGREQQTALMKVAEGIAAQAATLTRLQEGEKDLIHLQAVLHQNLAALASASHFDEAVHSLTAAVHLLTARTPAAGAAAPPARPGKAA